MFGYQLWIYVFRSQYLNLWDWVLGFGYLGLGLRIWIAWLGSQDLDVWVWV